MIFEWERSTCYHFYENADENLHSSGGRTELSNANCNLCLDKFDGLLSHRRLLLGDPRSTGQSQTKSFQSNPFGTDRRLFR